MIKKLLAVTIVLFTFCLFTSSVLAYTDFFNFKKPVPNPELNRNACKAEGKAVIDVVQKVQNDVDSGLGSNAYFPGQTNYWNVESYTRHIKVWQDKDNDPTTWCAIVTYENGHFDAFYKQTGPGGTGLIGSGVDGVMRGGYRAVFNGTMLQDPAWAKKGNIGTFDYNCDLLANCPGRVDWVAQYFGPGYTNFDRPYWGWTYNAGKHGVWVNASTGNSGNIL